MRAQSVKQTTIDKVLSRMQPGEEYTQRLLRTNRKTLNRMVQKRLIRRVNKRLKGLRRPEETVTYIKPIAIEAKPVDTNV